MAAESDSNNGVLHILALEREILRSLCSTRHPDLLRDAMLRSLSQHVWHDPDHRVIYEALRQIPSSAPAAIRDQLPATVTRMGFPDVDLKPYFDASETRGAAETQDAADIEALIRALQRASAPAPNPQ